MGLLRYMYTTGRRNAILGHSHFQYRLQQEAQGPQLAHLSETATVDMQMACNIFPILSNIETYDKAMA